MTYTLACTFYGTFIVLFNGKDQCGKLLLFTTEKITEYGLGTI